MTEPTFKRRALVRFAADHPRLVVIAATVATLAAFYPMMSAQVDTDPVNMLPVDEPVRVAQRALEEDFELYDYLIVGKTGESNIWTPDFATRWNELADSIAELEGVVVSDIMAPTLVDDIYRTPDGILTVGPLAGDRPEMPNNGGTTLERINNNPLFREKLASSDGRSAVMYVAMEDKKLAHTLSERIQHLAGRIGGLGQLWVTGLPVAEETFGVSMFKQMGITAPAAGLLIFLLLLVFFRKRLVVLGPLALAMITVFWSMGLLTAFGFTLHIMSSMIPIFLMPIAVLDSVHVLSEFHDRFAKSRNRKEAIVSTLEELYSPMLFTSLTTMVGFGSLVLAPIPPVRVFGLFVAFGVGAAWLLSMTFAPAFATLLPEKALKNFGARSEGRGLLARLLPPFMRWGVRRRAVVVSLAGVWMVLAAVGVSRIVVNDNPTKWFKESHPVRMAQTALGERMAGTYLAHLVFETDEIDGLKKPGVMRYIDRVQQTLDRHPNVGATSGITDVIKKVRYELKDGDPKAAIIPGSAEEIAQEIFLYEASGGDPDDLFKFITPDADRANLWVQMKDGDNLAVAGVAEAADDFMQRNPLPDGVTAHWSGLAYVNVVWQQKMVTGMRNALLGSFVIVSLMMIGLLRSILWGLVSMIPLSVTIAGIYGAIGYIGKAYDMPIAILSSLTLGLSIDFAIHYLQRAREIRGQGLPVESVLERMSGEPARAIARNIVVVALAFMPLLFSDLVPYITVGAFFLIIMILSGITTLQILPALVRLGARRFYPNAAPPAGRKDEPIEAPATAS